MVPGHRKGLIRRSKTIVKQPTECGFFFAPGRIRRIVHVLDVEARSKARNFLPSRDAHKRSTCEDSRIPPARNPGTGRSGWHRAIGARVSRRSGFFSALPGSWRSELGRYAQYGRCRAGRLQASGSRGPFKNRTCPCGLQFFGDSGSQPGIRPTTVRRRGMYKRNSLDDARAAQLVSPAPGPPVLT